MKRLGISIYPSNGSLEEIKNYIELAAKYGFKRIFTCLISQEDRIIEEVIEEFREIVATANKSGMEVIADVEPSIFEKFGVTYKDLKFFYDLGLKGIRLDTGFSGIEESIMTYNHYGLKIELNISNGTKYLDNILSYKANMENIWGCHNFYPHVYTGLSYEHFIRSSKRFKEQGIRTAAFVNAPSAEFGPWPVSEGLCTLESHRNLPITVQGKHLFATDLIDDVIIANMFASEEELKALSKLNKNIIEFEVEFVDGVPELQKKIALEEFHFNRGDVSEYMVRSTQSRVKYKGHEFKVFNTRDIKRGDILVESDLYTRYAGELQIALKDMKNSGKTNVIGSIIEEERFLLDYLEPWDKFELINRK
ncbi:DUF871 domain-containing protein [Clostridium sp.]|uniref:DUF871 domain-containing protein n=1 Tax=Clostridium sp. TaxID=1506 RepID=UPI003463B98A